MKFGVRKLESFGLPDGAEIMTQYRRVTDRRTDTLRSLLPRYSIASRG